jgi:hypothetical protein
MKKYLILISCVLLLTGCISLSEKEWNANLAFMALMGSVIFFFAATGWYCERKWERECKQQEEAWERKKQQAKLEAERKAQAEAKYERSLLEAEIVLDEIAASFRTDEDEQDLKRLLDKDVNCHERRDP